MNRLPAPELPDWLARLVPFERYRVQLAEHAMHVMEVGQGLPVVMLHGNPTWGFLYRRVAQLLSRERLRLIMPDLLGLGFSDRIEGPAHTLELHARKMHELWSALKLEPFILVVQDWGGAIGGCALAYDESRLKGLVVLNTVLAPPRSGFRPTPFHRFSQLPLVSDAVFRWGGFPQNALRFAQGDRQSITGEVARAYRFPLKGVSNNAAPLWLARMAPNSTEHPSIAPMRRCQEVMERFRGPVEIVWGDRDPVIGRAFKRVHSLFPTARVTRTQAGHFLQEEVPELIADAVRRVTASG
jgi:cis-3-alkyl-4-acyloxetan-2-one decarboxylase